MMHSSLEFENFSDSASASRSSAIGDTVVSINRVYSAFVIIIGTIGNVYCLYVIRSTNLKKFSSSQYLTALACSDLGFLVSLSLTWLSGAGIRWYDVSGLCQLTNYASYVCCFLSAWYIVALTMERCVVVYRPFYARTLASPKRARAVICVITVCGLAMNSFVLILVDSQPIEQSLTTQHDAAGLPRFHAGPSRKGGDQYDLTDRLGQIDQYRENDHRLDRVNRTDVGMEIRSTLRRNDSLDDELTSFRWPELNESQYRPNWSARSNFPTASDFIEFYNFSSSDNAAITTDKKNLYVCLDREDTTYIYQIFTTMDMIFSFSIPLSLTFLFNIFICVRLFKASRERERMLASAFVLGSFRECLSQCPIQMELKTVSPAADFNIESSRSRVDRSIKNEETRLGDAGSIKDRANAAPSRRHSFNENNNDPLHSERTVIKPLIGPIRDRYNRLKANTAPAGASCSDKERHITVFLLSISLTHLILNLPSYLHRLIVTVLSAGSHSRNDGSNEKQGDAESVVISVLYLLFYTQFAVNFILYSCQSRRIRGGLRRRSH